METVTRTSRPKRITFFMLRVRGTANLPTFDPIYNDSGVSSISYHMIIINSDSFVATSVAYYTNIIISLVFLSENIRHHINYK